jgi:oxygen-dependent protoporphyrinogen oxidase
MNASSTGSRHVVVVGGGITGLAAAHQLTVLGLRVTLLEADDRLGGKIRTSPFAGLPAVDEGPDAFLTRVPFASTLAREVGLGEQMTSPASGSASIWNNGMHTIPTGLMLGVPTGVNALALSPLMSWRGKARAALEPVLPRRSVPEDNLGALVRSRFGNEVHEMLVDPLVGSIYASDTDRLSMSAVPQLGDLARRGRSLLISGRRMRAAAPTTTGPIFESPLAGVGALVDAVAASLRAAGADLRVGSPVVAVERNGTGQRVVCADGTTLDADGVVLASPAHLTADLVRSQSPSAAGLLEATETSSVAMVTLAVPGSSWPATLTGSGYLVPKKHQRTVTAVSFASNKWAHWRPADGSVILRTSLGRDGLVVDDRSDDDLVSAALDEVSRHIGVDLTPTAVRLTRWPDAFPQYRPGHMARVDRIESALAADAPGVVVAGAGHRGIGIPACVHQGRNASSVLAERLGIVGQSTP